MTTKKGQALSVEMVVKIILGIVMLSAGLGLFFMIVNKTDETQFEVDARIQDQIRGQLSTGTKIYIYKDRLDANQKDFVKFDIGVNNIYSQPLTFTMTIDPLSPDISSESIIANTYSAEIPAKQVDFFLFVLDNPKSLPDGQHGIAVNFTFTNPTTGETELYDNTKIVYVVK